MVGSDQQEKKAWLSEAKRSFNHVFLMVFVRVICSTAGFPRRESRKMVVISTLKKEGKKNDHSLISDIERLGLLEGKLWLIE